MFNIISWYLDYKRDLPWRGTKDPYKIWLSEILLQQTRVSQGIGYYNRFISNFPTIFDLAEANIDEILLFWQGLGYYSRARNLHETAINIRDNFNGKFPENYNELRKFKGIGEYTAAAIASIAFGIPEAVVDGNVYRVLSRFFADKTPIDSSLGKKRFKELAGSVLNKENPGYHNEALMELGATICLPKIPKCNICPIQDSCLARGTETISSFPVKTKKTKQRLRYLYFFIISYKKGFYIEKRVKKDIWRGLFQFPLIELEEAIDIESIDTILSTQLFYLEQSYSIVGISKDYKHVLSHQIIYGKFIHIEIESEFEKNGCNFISRKEIDNYAMPRLITRYLEENHF